MYVVALKRRNDMHSIKNFVPAPILKASLKVIARISPLILLVLAACGPAALPATPVTVLATPTEVPATQTLIPATPTVEVVPFPTSTPEEPVMYPYYLPLATKPDIASQTINGVTAQIDWAYVDESRVALHYTISGLEWPDGTTWDAMSVQINSA